MHPSAPPPRGIFAVDSSAIGRLARSRMVMTLFSTFSTAPARARKARHRAHFVPLAVGGGAAVAALALVAYLLWPTWGAVSVSDAPAKLPVSIGNTLFNVPTAAIRMKIQRHSGPQERIDLSFAFPSLEPPDGIKHVSADAVEEAQPIDRIFLSIAAHHDSLAPDMRVRTIYPRYLEQASAPGQDGLAMRAFRDNTPYGGEDLFFANSPSLSARCTRDAATPGMCLSERRIDGADLTFRFPRSWLAQWREVANAMDRLTLQLHG
jgi:hypothetical protein